MEDAQARDVGQVDRDRTAILAGDHQPAGAQGHGGALAFHALAPQRVVQTAVKPGSVMGAVYHCRERATSVALKLSSLRASAGRGAFAAAA